METNTYPLVAGGLLRALTNVSDVFDMFNAWIQLANCQ